VWCTIVGLDADANREARIFDGSQVRVCNNISPYIVPGPTVICAPQDTPLSPLPTMKMGSNAVDGKRLVLEQSVASELLKTDPTSKVFLKRYGGTKELLSGVCRWCIWVRDENVELAKTISFISDRINDCQKYRKSAGRDARKAANRPHAFCYSTYEEDDFIHVGNTIGNALDFVPADVRKSGYVSNHNAFTIYRLDFAALAVVISTLHRVWAETVAGRLGNGTRYGSTVVYNTFPVPRLTKKNNAEQVRCAEDILLAREHYFPATIADMYDPERMDEEFPLVRQAHERNDETLERIYIGRRFKNDTERLEKLFELYTRMTKSKEHA
jgi:hypothetical protein